MIIGLSSYERFGAGGRILALLVMLHCASIAIVSARPDPDRVKYHHVKIWLSENFTLDAAAEFGIDDDHSIVKAGGWIESIITDTEFERIRARGVRAEIVHSDMEALYARRLQKESKFHDEFLGAHSRNFRFGSMGGYYRLSEAYREFERMRSAYPDVAGPADTIGFFL